MNKSWIIYGPQGSGKTVHSSAIAKTLGLRRVVDDWAGKQGAYVLTDTLYLTNDLPGWARDNRRVMTIDQALAKLDARALKTPNVGGNVTPAARTKA